MHPLDLTQLGRRAEGRVDFVRVIEKRIINFVLPGLFAKSNNVLEPVTP